MNKADKIIQKLLAKILLDFLNKSKLLVSHIHKLWTARNNILEDLEYQILKNCSGIPFTQN
jgi:hypothetical protein